MQWELRVKLFCSDLGKAQDPAAPWGLFPSLSIRIISLALGRAGLPKSVQRHQPDLSQELRAGFCVLLPILEMLAVVESPNSALCGCKLPWSCPRPCRISWNGWEGFAGITRQQAQARKAALQNSGSWSRGALPSCEDREAQTPFPVKDGEHRDAPWPGHPFLAHSPMFLQ